MTGGVRGTAPNEADPADDQLAAALRRIGELSMANELLRAKMERPGPLARGRSR